MNNSTTKHDTTELLTPFHSQSTAHFNDIDISCYEKNTQNWQNPLIIVLAFHPILPFLQCAQSTKQFISVHSPS